MSSTVTIRPGIGFFDLRQATKAARAWTEESRGQGPYAEGFEVYHHPRQRRLLKDGLMLAPGWYWQEPNQDPVGPFASAERAAMDGKKAIRDVNEVLKVL